MAVRCPIHGLFHVVEWIPDMKDRVVQALRDRAEREPEPLLRAFAVQMAKDIDYGSPEHVLEPVFPHELEG